MPGCAAGCPQPAAGAEEEEKEEEAAEEAGPPMRSRTAPRRAGGGSRLAPRAAHTHRCPSRAPALPVGTSALSPNVSHCVAAQVELLFQLSVLTWVN